MKIKDLFIIFLLLISASFFSCIHTTSSSTAVQSDGTSKNSISSAFAQNIVQIYDGDKNLGSGVAVSDGSLVLTAINYEYYSPGLLKVLVAGQGAFEAVIQAVDPRTSITLIKMQDITLPAAKLGDSSTIIPGQKVIVRSWVYNAATNNQDFQEEPGLVGDDVSEFQFPVNWQNPDMYQSPQPISGAVVFNESSEVIGIGGVTPGFMHLPLANVVKINTTKDLISGNTEQQPWYKGPILLYTRYTSDQGGSIQYDSEVPKNYQDVVLAIENVINNVGIPVTGDESVKKLGDITEDSTILIAVFARPVQLHNGEEVVATAKWIGIQKLDFNTQFTRLYYGNKTYVIDGEFNVNAVIPLPGRY